MDDRHAFIRAALDAGPKSGKWTWKQVGSFNTPGCAVLWPDTSKGGVHYRRIDSGGGMDQVDAEFIAACHPEAIRALLTERDALRAAVEALLANPSGVYCDGYPEAERKARAALAQEQS